MKAAVVTAPGATPIFTDFLDPVAGAGMSRITVRASSVSHVTRSRASGRHYSASAKLPSALPFVPGLDGTGVRDDGTRVYFVLPEAPFGGMAEQCIVKDSLCIPLPDALDDVTAAAIAIPGMSSWAALTERAKFVKGETVLINGATGTSGRLAVQIAKHWGAAKVIATGRDVDSLASLQAIGADVVLNLSQDHDSLVAAFQTQFREGVDVVLDYLWGPSAERLLEAATKASRDAVPVRFVQIGASSAPTITLPSAALRSSPIELMGSGIGSIPVPRILHAISQLFDAAVPAGLKTAVKVLPLSQVAEHWHSTEGRDRIVFTMTA